VTLRPLRTLDRAAIRRWMAEPEVIRFTVLVPGPDYAPVRPYSTAAADRYLRTLIGDQRRRAFAVEVDGRHVGNVGLKELDLAKGDAECFVEIGELSMRGMGVGTHAMRMMLDVAFDELALEQVRLGVFEFNEAAKQLYLRLGFSPSGTYGHHWFEGRFWHVDEMTMPAVRWRAQSLR
jgi:RimJ/RimL family protein N-acetyltransferase